MCPLRFILVFFSAVLAGYFAWRTVRSSPDDDLDSADATAAPTKDARQLKLNQVVQDGFWGFVDMASGRYLWRNLKEMRAASKTA